MKNQVQPYRSRNIVLAICLIFLICILIWGHSNKNSLAKIYTSSNSIEIVEKDSPTVTQVVEKSFLTLGQEVGTDKVTVHKYQCVYEESLIPYRHVSKLKILEIGLESVLPSWILSIVSRITMLPGRSVIPHVRKKTGCNMPYGPGASMKLWQSYFTDAQIYFLEYDQKCGEQWHERLTGPKPIMTYGDQANLTLLKKMVADHGPWDIIVDDGGHTMTQQINSFMELFPAVKPGGIYYLEDLSTSLVPKYGGTVTGVSDNITRTAISFVAEVLAWSIKGINLGVKVDRITCCDEMCAFRTKQN